jgi:hypothetical protein
MPIYRVRWFIDIEAETPEAAVLHALQIQRVPDSIATVFDVRDQDGDASSWHPIDAAPCGDN